MEYKNCEEYILNEYLFLKDAIEKLNQEYQRVHTECKNLNDIVVFLRGIINITNDETKFNISFSDDVYADTPQGKFYRDALLGLFGPNKIPLNPIDPPVQPSEANPTQAN